MQKIRLVNVDQVWLLNLISEHLSKNEISFEVVEKPREYASVITGVGGKSYDIMVNEKDHSIAQKLIAQLQTKDPSAPESDADKVTPNYLKRVVVFSVLGIVMVPILFNIIATLNYASFCRYNKGAGGHVMALLFLLLGWCSSLFITYYLVTTYIEHNF